MALMTKTEVENVLSELHDITHFEYCDDRSISFTRLSEFFPSTEAIEWLANPDSSVVPHDLVIEFFDGDGHYNIDKLIEKLESILLQGPTLLDTSNWKTTDVYK
tara:strand:+ start:57260 stop:57571 length:312 start_codon:yes stop_codon:yes gene_type:complete